MFLGRRSSSPLALSTDTLKQRTQNNVRIDVNAAVHTSVILEYFTSEVLELAGASRALLSALLSFMYLRIS